MENEVEHVKLDSMEQEINNVSPAEERIFNYDNIFFSFFYNNENACIHKSREHAMNYVYSGEMLLDDGKKKIHVRKGECVFIKRDHRVTMHKKGLDGERYCGIFLMFTRDFLREMYTHLGFDKSPMGSASLKPSVIKLPVSMEIESLFSSMVPYFNRDIRPKDDMMHLKLQEGLLSLLHTDERFAPVLFDFNERWKIDIIEFMNRNYMYDLSLEELAHFTGRSKSTFKRDFAKISELSPQKWMIKKRLEVAYEKMKEGGKKVQDVYVEVGFKNSSHFTTAFKKEFGIPPTAVLQ